MKITPIRERLLASSMICGAALLGLSAMPAAAQQAGAEVSEVVVTGSRIPQPNLSSTSPITVVSSEDVRLQGVTRTEDLLNSLPQAVVGQNSGVSNGSSGTATVDLRNLGPTRTLVLVDGRRVVPGDPTTPATDLNFIPSPLIERVDVLTGGASAVYGSDAIGGVVNFVMLKNFEGIRLEAQVGEYQHNNDNDFVQGLNRAANITPPTGSVWDGRQTQLTAVLGVNSSDGKGNATAYVGYRSVKAVTEDARDYSNCTLGETATSLRCIGSGSTFPTHIVSVDLAAPNNNFILDSAGPGNTLRAFNSATDSFNFAPFNYFQRPDEQYTAGVFAHYEINSHIDAYTQIMFMDDHTRAQIAPTVTGGLIVEVACDSPLLSAQQVDTLCTAAGLGPADSATLSILRRNVEGGPRVDDLRHTDYRAVIGARGDLNESWSYDIYAQLGRAVFQETYLNDFSFRRLSAALNITTDASGNLVCADPAAQAEGCVPYNIFSIDGVTPEALAFVQIPGLTEGTTTEQVVSGSLNGTLGFAKSPWATDGIGVAGGFEYRRENLEFRPDLAFQTGDLAGQGGPQPAVSGTFDVYELFGEARIPLAQDLPFAKDLTLELGFRWSDYSSVGTADTYKVAGDWRPVDDLRLRASYQKAVRAPNALELFNPPQLALALSDDPCAGTMPEATEAQCANTGVSATQYGNILENTANQYNAVLSGNQDLEPEEADTYSVGVVLTPRAIPGLSIAVDYFDIKVQKFIQTLNADSTLASCLTSGDPTSCGLVHRDSLGTLWLSSDGFVEAPNTNIGFLQTKGVDLEVNYRTELERFGLANWGGLSVNLVGTYLDEFVRDQGISTTDAAGRTVTTFDCTGLFGGTCGVPLPEWRHRLRVTWNTPWDGLQISGAWRYFGSVDLEATSSNPFLNGSVPPAIAKIDAQDYFDLTGSYRFKDRYTFRVGVNNVFDEDPPLLGGGAGGNNALFNGNTFTNYDTLGRFAFVSVSADF